MDTQLAALQSDTNDIQARLPAALVSGRMDASVGAMAANVMTAAAAAADLTTELQSGLATAAALSTVGTAVDAVKLKTDNLPSDPADQSLIIAAAAAIQADIAGLTPPDNAGIAAIQAKTDLLTFTGANANVNVEAVNGLAVAGTGTEADPWVPA
jgi:ActR/RegA family two-component response regulator